MPKYILTATYKGGHITRISIQKRVNKPLVILGLFLLFSAFGLSCIFILQIAEDDAVIYAHTSMPALIKAQEQHFGIKYNELPSIVVGLPIGLSTTNPGNKSTIHGVFFNGTIYLKKLPVFFYEKPLWSIAVYFISLGNAYDIEKVLHHELVHFYLHNSTNNPHIEEGIAEYVSREMVNDTYIFPSWHNVTRKELEGMVNEPLYYDILYALVKPIIDKYGKESIVFLLQHPPAADEELLTYRQRIIKEIDKQ